MKSINTVTATPSADRSDARCWRCGRAIDPSEDAWRIEPGHRYEHLTCPVALTDAAAGALPAGEALPRFITMDEAAEFLRVSKATIRLRVRSGELPAKRLKGGQTVLIEIRDVLALLEPYTGRD